MKKKFLRFMVIFCSLFLLNKSATAQTYVTNGLATLIDAQLNEYRLTVDVPGTIGFGTVWYQNKLDLRNDFTVTGQINLGTNDDTGADGIAFVLQPLSVNAGGAGGGIGYFGINPSFAVEFDTYYNPDRFDPPQDHSAIQINGDVTHDAAHTIAGPTIFQANIEDGTWHDVTFKWIAATKNFRLYWNGATSPFFDVIYDISANIFSGSPYAYFGFTAAVGSYTNDQRVRILNTIFVSEGVSGTVKNASCSSVADGAIDIPATGLTAPLNYLWNNGATSQDLTGILPGTYSVTVTDAATPQRTIISTFVVGSDANPTTWYKDADNDGYSDGTTQMSCVQPSGYKLANQLTTTSGDCDDNNKEVHPGATEICGNGIDDNCDGQIDEGCTAYTFYKDADGDTYGDPASSVTNYTGIAPAGYVTNKTDCNDNNKNVNPAAVEICGNGIDDNCNGQIDEGCSCSVTVSICDANITEGNCGTKLLCFAVSLSKAAAAISTVKYKTSNGSAMSSSDYKAADATITFNAGQSVKYVCIIINGDYKVEQNETFYVTLYSPVNLVLGNKKTATGIIINDDKCGYREAGITSKFDEEARILNVPTLLHRSQQFKIPNLPANNKVMLYSANGRLVLNAANYSNNASLYSMAAGMYYYNIIITNKEGRQEMFKGKIIVMD